MREEIDSCKGQLGELSLTKRLIGTSDQGDICDLDQGLYTQSVVNLLVRAGKIAKAAGHGSPTDEPFGIAQPKLMLVEIESMLADLLVLIAHAQNLARQQMEKLEHSGDL